MTGQAPAVVPAPAATVVLLREGPAGLEALLTVRPATMAFAAGMHVFPGGRVDADDGSPPLLERSALGMAAAAARLGGDLEPDAALATHIAAIRELWEECGVLLADTSATFDAVAAARAALLDGSASFAALAAELDLVLRTDLLVPLSRWVTPPGYPRRFDARFFAAVLPDAGLASIASDEVVAIDWHTPRAALDAMADGGLAMWLPTSTTLQQLEHVRSSDDLARLAPGPIGPVSVDDVAADVVRIVMPAGGGVAGQPVCAYLVGRRRLVLVDPGDPTGLGLERCLEIVAARGGTIEAIALTHVDPDHHAGAEALAERLAVPVLAGPRGGRELPYDVIEVGDGAVVEQCDVGLTVLATPGPRPDHVALLVGERSAVLTGDLDGIRGARSIPGPADETAWAASRARVDALGDRAVRLGGHPGRGATGPA
jgi:glyoxylase-like metal-dependent hydrolase (beta-lactamase superfamily II)/8-oxo-dGTP pyrophosphatase MutT (NUDIX family)